MQYTAQLPHSLMADALYSFHSPVTWLPSYSHVFPYLDSRHAQGSGVGNARSSVLSAFGEVCERKHFFHRIRESHRFAFLKYLPEAERLAMESFLEQFNVQGSVHEKEFGTIGFTNLNNGESRQLPSILVDLNHENEDRKIIPTRDSCGAAGHQSPLRSFQVSLMEYIERQCLIFNWLYKRPAPRLDLQQAMSATRWEDAARYLSDIGRLSFHNLSLPCLGAKTVLATYFAKSENQTVRFAIGCAAGKSLKDACAAAFEELWLSVQSVRLNSLNQSKDGPVHELYLREFFALNSIQTMKVLAYLDIPEVSKQAVDDTKISDNEILRKLLSLTPHIYLYSASESVLGVGTHYYSKIFSPDLYLHMNPSNLLNRSNALTRKYGLKSSQERRLIPFP